MKNNLSKNPVSFIKFFLFLCLFFGILILPRINNKSLAQTSVNGSIEHNGNQMVLNLWGTNYEMGYAHGYLLADKIKDVIETFLIGRIGEGDINNYNAFLNYQETKYVWPNIYLEEVQGMKAGMIASGIDIYLPSLGRNVNIQDIKALNLVIEFSMYCSSFGVWGTGTNNGQTLTARNLDFVFDQEGNLANNQFIVTYDSQNGTKFVALTFPGMIGVISGMNEQGIVLTINMGNSSANTSNNPYTASTLVMRNILEMTRQENYLTYPIDYLNSVEELKPFLILIGTPYQGVDNPVYFIEDATESNPARYSDETDPDYDIIIGTNHFIKVIPPPTSGDSLVRYNRIRDQLINLYHEGDGKVDEIEAWTILQNNSANGGTNLTNSGTLHSFIAKPNSLEFYASFASLSNNVFTKATANTPQRYLWTDLFPSHDTLPTPTEIMTPTPTVEPTPTYVTPTPTPTPSLRPFYYVSIASAGDEDIYKIYLDDGSYETYFDGSDVGVGPTNLDAFHILPSGNILFSTSGSVTLSEIGLITAQDIVEFVPTRLGETTGGLFRMYFDGSDVGLSSSSENIDGISVLSDGRILISAIGNVSAPGLPVMVGEDILAFTPTSLGWDTTGSWSIYFDGSDVGLRGGAENIDAMYVEESGKIDLSTTGSFSVPGVSGTDEDIFQFTPTSLGSNTSGSYSSSLIFDGSSYGYSSYNVDGFQIPE